MQLVAITRDGQASAPIGHVPKIVGDILRWTATHYSRAGFEAPWIGYLGVEGDTCVGACGFKSTPQGGKVEIAYITFPENEGRGVATRMAALLIELARQHDSSLTITAQTLPQVNASNAILKKLGFTNRGEVEHPEDGVVWEWHLPPNSAA